MNYSLEIFIIFIDECNYLWVSDFFFPKKSLGYNFRLYFPIFLGYSAFAHCSYLNATLYLLHLV